MAWSSSDSASRIEPCAPRAISASAAGVEGDAFGRRGCRRAASAISARRQRLQVELQAARQHRDRDLLRIGRRQHELHVLGRLLERLQHRVERRLRQHVHFVDQVDLVAARPSARSARCRASRACCRCRCSTPRRARAGRRSGRRRCRVHAGQTPQGVAVTPCRAVEALGEDARDRRLADAARAGEQVGVVQAPARQRVGQRRDDVLLPGRVRRTSSGRHLRART